MHSSPIPPTRMLLAALFFVALAPAARAQDEGNAPPPTIEEEAPPLASTTAPAATDPAATDPDAPPEADPEAPAATALNDDAANATDAVQDATDAVQDATDAVQDATDAVQDAPDAVATQKGDAPLKDDAPKLNADASPSHAKKGGGDETKAAKADAKKKDGAAADDDSTPPPPGMLALQGGQSWVFRGSSVTVRNSFAPVGLLRDAELTWNPTYAVTTMIQPRIWFGNIFNLQGYLDVTREITQSDFTTYDGELQLSDMWLSGAATNFWTIPLVDVGLNASVSARIPTSKISRGNTMLTAVGGNGTAIKAFNLFDAGALIFGYSLNLTKFFHRYTTGENATSLKEGRCNTAAFCGIYASTGVRNVDWSSSNRLFGLLSMFNMFGAFVDARVITQTLYPVATHDGRISFNPVNQRGTTPAQNTRFLTWTSASVFFQPHQALTASLGVSTFHNQLAPNGQYRFPGINRFTQVNFDLTFNLGGAATLATEMKDYFDW